MYDFDSSSKTVFIFFVAVQHERGPRNSTIRRQVAMYLKETSELSNIHGPFRPPYLSSMFNDGITVSAVDSPPAPSSSAGVMVPTPKVGFIQ